MAPPLKRLKVLTDAIRLLGPDAHGQKAVLMFVLIRSRLDESQIGDGKLLEKIIDWIIENPDAFKDLIQFIVELFK